MNVSLIARDFVERALWTAGQQFFSVLVLTGSSSGLLGLPWEIAIATSIGAAIVSLITTVIQYIPALKEKVGKSFWTDLLFRLAKTFLASFLGVLGAAQVNILTVDWVHALNVAALATIMAAAKGFLASGPDNENPSTLQPQAYKAIYSG